MASENGTQEIDPKIIIDWAVKQAGDNAVKRLREQGKSAEADATLLPASQAKRRATIEKLNFDNLKETYIKQNKL